MSFDATIVVKFGDSVSADDEFAVIELDDTRNLDDDGEVKNSFYPGDDAYFWVHLGPDLEITKATKTAGTLTDLGATSRTIEKQIFFTEYAEENDIGYYVTSINGNSYWGNEPSYTLLSDKKTLVNDSQDPNIFMLEFTIAVHSFKLTPPTMELTEDESYPIGVVIHVEKT